MLSFSRSQILFESSQERREKALLVANTGWYLYNFRLPLAKALRNRGITVVFVSPWDPYVEKLKEQGFWWIELDLIRRSTNPFLEIYSILRLVLIYWVEKPDIVHNFTIKCVLYGTIAAKLSGVRRVVNAITGLGYVFINTKLKARLLRLIIQPLYFFVLNADRGQVIVQNKDDFELLIRHKLVSSEKTSLIRSSGVDLKRFCPDITAQRIRMNHHATPCVLLASRIVGDKGIYEYVEAARQLRTQGHSIIFKLAGALYPGNPTAISEEEIASWEADGILEWVGHVDDMELMIATADIVVLPSHGGEGVPKILIEAAAMAKPIVATDVPGCRDVVQSGENGFLIPVKQAEPLTEAIEILLKDSAMRERMGKAGRLRVSREFDVELVVGKTLSVYETMGVVFNTTSHKINAVASTSYIPEKFSV